MNPTTQAAAQQLAIEGGTPLRTAPLAPWPQFTAEEVEAAAQVLRSGKVNYWTGTEGVEFEREYAAYTGRKHAIALANGTVALELALLAFGIGDGDDVIVPCRTFLATASCAVARRARPVIADIDRETQALSAETIRAALTPKTRAVIVVHLNGCPADMDPILELARERGFIVIEDCAQAHGARYKGRPVGSMGDAGAFSFCQDKIITTGGEGGMLVLNDTAAWERAWAYKDHGKSYRATFEEQHPPGFRWLAHTFGTNWRLTEMQSAVGRLMLRRLDAMVAKRRENAALLASLLEAEPALRVVKHGPETYHAFYKLTVFVRPERLREGWTRQRIIDALNAEGIPCFVGGSSEIYLEKAFTPEMRPSRRMPVGKELGETTLMFLVHPTLGEADMRDTAAAVRKVLAVAAL